MTSSRGPERGAEVVLVVERDPGVAELERLYLAREGFDVVVEADPTAAVAAAAALRPVAVVLDLSGPRGPGLYDQIATAADPAPVVSVAAAGVEPPLGAAHHVVRPFSPRQLVAAVAEVLRDDDDGEAEPPGVLRSGSVTLDRRTRTATVNGRSAVLTAAEFDLLEFLLRNPGRVYSREQLLAGAWDVSGSVGVRTVDVHVAQLRAKLGQTSPIRTVRGVGYVADG